MAKKEAKTNKKENNKNKDWDIMNKINGRVYWKIDCPA